MKRKRNVKRAAAAVLSGVLLAASVIIFVFVAVWGLGHFGPSAGEQMGLETREYTEEELKSYEEFLYTDKIDQFIEENPEYSIENIERFVEENNESGVPEDLLSLLLRNEYFYRMDYDKRPVVIVDYDDVLQEALEFLGKEI